MGKPVPPSATLAARKPPRPPAMLDASTVSGLRAEYETIATEIERDLESLIQDKWTVAARNVIVSVRNEFDGYVLARNLDGLISCVTWIKDWAPRVNGRIMELRGVGKSPP